MFSAPFLLPGSPGGGPNTLFNILNKYSILGRPYFVDPEKAMAGTETNPATAVERALSILEAAAQRRDGLNQF